MTPERFDAGSADRLVFTGRAGLLSAIAHDLKLRVGRFEIKVGADSASILRRCGS